MTKHHHVQLVYIAHIIEFDKKIRKNSRKKEEEVYVHRTCKPISEVDLNKGDNQLNLFNNECEGMCGV